MTRRRLAALLLCLAPGAVRGQQKTYSHAQYFQHYEGTKTCLECHRQEAENFFGSQHYQWRGPAPQIENSGGKKLGKINTINDFCTSPTGNWIGLVRNSRGEVISKGCSACHAGRGLLPSNLMDERQLQNIDCLICHASGYRRDLYPANSGFEWKPILWQNREGLDSVAKRISLPTRAMCLRCHAASGGGPNYKRGDLEYKLADCDRDFDVHMASSGKNLQCVACHAGDNHRVRGRGADLSGSDMPGKPLGCTEKCHGSAPHAVAVLNRHAKRVNCTVCHIPSFAREDATDMARDWSKSAYNPEADKYTATITFEKNVRPVYAWFNGFTRAQLPGQAVRRLSDGSVGIMLPLGSRQDPEARIHAFKVHKARLPLLEGKQWIIPIVVEQFFPNGKIDPAVRRAAEEMYGVGDPRYTWTATTRYMGIYHGVQPASKALQCLDCHSPKGRMDWKALGYSGDPLDALLAARARK
ncbi:MAG: hypothetical protein HYS04_05575 [Acidobacteria bacterium]|nr:hypothetical protein [Acidobacteriota bacterium]